MTALAPAVLVATTVQDEPAAADTVKCSHAPWLKAVVRAMVCVVLPHVTETVCRRAVESQSSA